MLHAVGHVLGAKEGPHNLGERLGVHVDRVGLVSGTVGREGIAAAGTGVTHQ